MGWSPGEFQARLDAIERRWGEGALLDWFTPSAVGDPEYEESYARWQGAAASPAMARAMLQAAAEIDARHVLPAIHVPARAIRCARPLAEAAKRLGVEIRAGLQSGECELIGNKVGGITIHIGARAASNAGPGEVVVSSTVKDLVAGSGIRFVNRRAHVLKGVPGEWRLFAVERLAHS